jgi:16S rRNA G966 N2-methylase RsmD
MIDFSGNNPLSFVISKNLKRRHLTASQQAVIALQVLPMLEEEAKKRQYAGVNQYSREVPLVAQGSNGKSRDKAAELFGIGKTYISDAKMISQKAPEMLDEIRSGEKTIKEAVKEVKRAELLEKRKEIASNKNINSNYIKNIRFQDAEIEPESIDLILTDPPYGIEYRQEWIDFAAFAERVLKPSGFLVSYFGQLNLLEYMNILQKNLQYYWSFALFHIGNKQIINPRNIFCGWKPILIYQKKPFQKLINPIEDIISGSGREKESHDWQQGLSEIEPIIKAFTIENEIVLDPFAGSGTTIISALKNNRKAIGFEINKESYLIATTRILEFENGK